MKPGFHKCPVPACPKQVQDNHLMCPTHWFKVPVNIQTAIYRTYFAGLHRNEHPTDEYIEHVEAALDHIAKLSAPAQGAFHLHA